MILLDANILLYRYNREAPEHVAITKWVNALLEGPEWVVLPWVTLWAFVRIATNPRIFLRPLTAAEAFSIVREWIAMPRIRVLTPGERHVEILERLITEHRAAGSLVSDAVLAALALEYGAVVASTDQDFSRFTGVKWLNPLAG